MAQAATWAVARHRHSPPAGGGAGGDNVVNRDTGAIVLSTSSSFFLWGVIVTIGPLAASGGIVGSVSGWAKVGLLIIGPIAMLFGSLIMGYLSDRVGRRRIFLWTMPAYSAGLLLIVASALLGSLYGTMAGLAITEFGIGGEEPPSLSLLTENTPPSGRETYLTLVPNFNNMGSAMIAGLLLISRVNFAYIILASAAALIGVMAYSRVHLLESFRWLRQAGDERDAADVKARVGVTSEGRALAHPGYLIGVTALITIGVSQFLTFGLMAYIIGPYEFASPTLDAQIIFMATLGASMGGFMAARLIRRGRKRYTLYSYLGGFLTMLVIFFLVGFLGRLLVFLPLLFLNMVMSEFCWASRTTLEPELFPTRIRGLGIGFIRVFPYAAYALSIYLTSSYSMYQFVLLNLVLWALGLGGALLWYLGGYETRGINPDYA